MKTGFGILAMVFLLGCGSEVDSRSDSPAVNPARTAAPGMETADSLYGEWYLVELQSMDDDIGIVRPDSTRSYTLSISRDGHLGMRLDCNSASATVAITPGTSPLSGQLSVGPVALTRAFCGEGSLDTRVAMEMEHMASYLIQNDRLHLAMKADGGIQVWGRR